MPNEVKLLPCPFCGGAPEAKENVPGTWALGVAIACSSSGCGARQCGPNADEAAARWNTRPTIVTDEVVERLRSALEPFAKYADIQDSHRRADDEGFCSTTVHGSTGKTTRLTCGDLRNARAALAAMPAIVGQGDAVEPRPNFAEFSQALLIAAGFYDDEELALWLTSPQPLLEMVTPLQLLSCGRAAELLQVMQGLEDGVYV